MNKLQVQDLFNHLDEKIKEIRFEGMYAEDTEDPIKHTDISRKILKAVCGRIIDLEKYLVLGIVKHEKEDLPHELPVGWLVEIEDEKGNLFYKKVADL